MADPYGWADREGILWRSEDGDVLVTSSFNYDETHYRITVNDEVRMEEQLVLNATTDEWLEVVVDSIKFAEGYAKGCEE